MTKISLGFDMPDGNRPQDIPAELVGISDGIAEVVYKREVMFYKLSNGRRVNRDGVEIDTAGWFLPLEQFEEQNKT